MLHKALNTDQIHLILRGVAVSDAQVEKHILPCSVRFPYPNRKWNKAYSMRKGLSHLALYHISPLYKPNLILTALQKGDLYSRGLALSRYRSSFLGFLSPTIFPSHLPVVPQYPISDSLLFPAGYFPFRCQLLRSFPKYQRKRRGRFKNDSS